MRIAIVTRDSEIHATQRLRETAERRGHTVEVVSILHSTLSVGAAEPELYLRGNRVPKCQAVIPRVGTFFPRLALAVAHHLESRGCIALNRAAAVADSIDKLRTLQHLASANIPVPRTVAVKDLDQLEWAIEKVGGAPVVVKPVEGSQGRRIILADSHEGALSVLESMVLLSQNVVVQEYIDSAGRDLRAFVVGDAVVAAVEREAPRGRFRTNFHQGGRLTAVSLSPELASRSVAAARAVGLDVAGVDIIPRERGALVLEVNASPGLEGIEQASGMDLAGRMIAYLEMRVDA